MIGLLALWEPNKYLYHVGFQTAIAPIPMK